MSLFLVTFCILAVYCFRNAMLPMLVTVNVPFQCTVYFVKTGELFLFLFFLIYFYCVTALEIDVVMNKWLRSFAALQTSWESMKLAKEAYFSDNSNLLSIPLIFPSIIMVPRPIKYLFPAQYSIFCNYVLLI